MFRPQQPQILENPVEAAENLANAMAVSLDFIEQWAPSVIQYPGQVSDDGRSVSFSFENGVPVDSNKRPLEGVPVGIAHSLKAYDEELVPAGLGALASFEARNTMYIPALEGSVHGPIEPEKAHLTGGFITSIGALHRLGEVQIDDLERKERKTIGKRAQRLAEVLVAVVTKYPDAIFLPPEAPTMQQAAALDSLEPLFSGRRYRETVGSIRSVTRAGNKLPLADIPAWEEELRKEHLVWLTQQEWDDRKAAMQAIFSDTRRFLSEQ